MSNSEVLAKMFGDRSWTVLHGRWQDVLPGVRVDHVITDPPYSEHVHSKSRRGHALPDTAEFECRLSRARELGFDPIDEKEMRKVAWLCTTAVRRWTLVFSDVESSHLWRAELTGSGLEYIRTGCWVKIAGAPQFTGDRPAAGFEAITICHPKGKKSWNGGGSPAVYRHTIVMNCSGHRDARVHTAQKPIELMCDLVNDFTDPGDVILDPYCGSGTTGVAAVQFGRRFIGVEQDAKYVEVARERLGAAGNETTVRAARMKQVPMFGRAKKDG